MLLFRGKGQIFKLLLCNEYIKRFMLDLRIYTLRIIEAYIFIVWKIIFSSISNNNTITHISFSILQCII